MSFICVKCDYETNDSGNFTRHKKTKKHIKNYHSKSVILSDNNSNLLSKISPNIMSLSEKDNFTCPFCNCKFTQKSNLSRHKKKCLKKEEINNIEKIKIQFLEKEKELIKKMENDKNILLTEMLKEKTEMLKEKTELLNNFMNSANKIINKEQDNNKITTDALKSVSMSALKYANEKFKNAPALLPLQNFNINNLDFNNVEDKKQLVEILIYNAKQKSLDKLLGDHIIKEYKKEKPEEQMFHTTDCSRLNYIVRQLIENALIWSIDKSGIEICSSIIKPLIKKCIDTLLEHQKYLLNEMGNGDLTKQKDVELIISILMSIDSGLLENDINKYIAPFFNLNKN